MAEAPNFAKLVPGFEFLQGLMKNAGSAMPNIGQWVAPTLNPEEIEKRIHELRTVQFWLEQNARMLEATIQALEVQRMTLSTLQTMNVQMEDLRDSLQIRLPESLGGASKGAKSDSSSNEAESRFGAGNSESPAAAGGGQGGEGSTGAAASGAARIDPLQWWGALTKQFTQLAANALNETTAGAAQNLAGNVMKQALESAANAGAGGSADAEGAGEATQQPAEASATPATKRRKPAAKRGASAKRAD